jgi:hypothetical protein
MHAPLLAGTRLQTFYLYGHICNTLTMSTFCITYTTCSLILHMLEIKCSTTLSRFHQKFIFDTVVFKDTWAIL